MPVGMAEVTLGFAQFYGMFSQERRSHRLNMDC